MKKISREYLPCIKKLVILFFVATNLVLPLGITVTSSYASAVSENLSGGLLKQSLAEKEGVLSLKLDGVTSYELTEIFNTIVSNTPGVIEARRYHLNLDPDYPKSCSVQWQITFSETTPFALESAIYNQLKEFSNNNSLVHVVNGSEITLTNSELEALKNIKPLQATSQALRFVQTLTFVEKQSSQWPYRRHHNHKLWLDCPNKGFE